MTPPAMPAPQPVASEPGAPLGAPRDPALLTQVLAATGAALLTLDAQGRVLAARAPLPAALQPPPGEPQALWAWSGVHMASDEQAALQSALRQGQACCGVHLRWQSAPDTDAQHWLLDLLAPDAGRGPDTALAQRHALLRSPGQGTPVQPPSAPAEDRFYELFYRLPRALVLHRAGRVLDANPAAVVLFGHFDLHAMLGQPLVGYLSSDAERQRMQQHLDALDTLPAGGSQPHTEFTLRVGSQLRDVWTSSVRVHSADGLVTLSMFDDQTERRGAMAALARSEALLSQLVSTSPDVICVAEVVSGKVRVVNRQFERVTGYRSDEVIGRTTVELGLWPDDAERRRVVELMLTTGHLPLSPGQFRIADGSLLTLHVTAAAFQVEGVDMAVLTARDLSANEQARMEYEAILQNASIGIALSHEGRLARVNPRLETMLGWQAGQLSGQPEGVLWPAAAPGALSAPEAQRALWRGEAVNLERPLRRRDGSTFWGRVRVRAVNPAPAGPSGTIWLVEDISEQRRIDQALAQARDAAEAASRAKSAFLANTSHEIRTPLNALLGLTELARSTSLSAAVREQYLGYIHDSAQTLSAILTDILDLSRIEAGKLTIAQAAFDLYELLTHLHAAHAALASSLGFALHLQVDAAVPPRVRGDAVRLRQILGNYLSNALKFAPTGACTLRASVPRAGVLRFEVQDQGPGLDAGDAERLFTPFTQADNSLTRSVGGTGLGLSICRELAQLMGGQVGVTSQASTGATFWLELPLPAEADAAPPPDTAWRATSLAPLRVLLVEDNPVNRVVASALLAQWGVQAVQAVDGHSAIDAVAAQGRAGAPFDAVLMDLQMPDISGHEVTRRLRQQFGPAQLPVIALTAAATPTEREAAVAAGMTDFLTKPIEPARLHAALAKAKAQVERGG